MKKPNIVFSHKIASTGLTMFSKAVLPDGKEILSSCSWSDHDTAHDYFELEEKHFENQIKKQYTKNN
jgi:hypothetical protein